MNGMDMIVFTISVAAALEIVTGRLAKLDRRVHRAGVIALYVVQACACILAGSLTWQGIGAWPLDVAALISAAHLVLTWPEWHRGAPLAAERGQGYPTGAVPMAADSRQDERR